MPVFVCETRPFLQWDLTILDSNSNICVYAGLNFLPGGDAAFVPHCPPLADVLEEEEQQDEEAEEEEEDQARLSVEVQIGQKLRQIGDQFQEDHVQLVRK